MRLASTKGPSTSRSRTGVTRTSACPSFTVANAGNAPPPVSKLHVEARDAANQVKYEQHVSGWYVLANGARDYSFPIPADVCSAVRTVAVRVESDRGKAETTIAAAPEHCSP